MLGIPIINLGFDRYRAFVPTFDHFLIDMSPVYFYHDLRFSIQEAPEKDRMGGVVDPLGVV